MIYFTLPFDLLEEKRGLKNKESKLDLRAN